MTFIDIFSSGTGEIDATEGEAVNTDADLFELCDGCADVDSVAAQPIEFGDDQYVALFHLVEQFGKALPLRDGHGTGDGLCDDAMRLNGKACRFDFLDLIFGCLIECGDTGVCECSGHGRVCYEMAVGNNTPVL